MDMNLNKTFFAAVAAVLVLTAVPSRAYASNSRGDKKPPIAQSDLKDSIKVLCTIYDKAGSPADNVLSFSAFVDCDSTKRPVYVVGDSIVKSISDIKADCISGLHFLYGDKMTKKYGKGFGNGILTVTLRDGVDYNSCQAIPEGDNLSRQTFVTKMVLADFNNQNGEFSAKARDYVQNYGTDDEVFRNFKAIDRSKASALLVIDSLNHKVFVNSMRDIKNDCIETISAYGAEDAVKIAGDRGSNGLVIILIKSKYTLNQAIMNAADKLQRLVNEMADVNMTMLKERDAIVVR